MYRTLTLIATCLLLSISINASSVNPIPDHCPTHYDAATPTDGLFYIFVKESTDSRELFPKLYPIGFILKEKNPDTKKITYILGEFNSRAKAEEALKVVKNSGYSKAHIIEKD